MRAWFLAVLVGAVAAAAPAPGKRCVVQLVNEDRKAIKNDIFNNGSNINYDAAGHVQLRCTGQEVYLNTDSLSALSGSYLRLYGHARYRDTSYLMTADTMIYILPSELLQARGNVHVYDKTSGSTMVGPYMDYYRQVKGVNDSARVVGLLRPVVRYFTRNVPIDTVHQHPYILVGNSIRGFGQSQLFANGDATLDRDSLHASGDSLNFVHGTISTGYLFGDLARLRRTGTDSLLVVGKKIRLNLADDRIRDLLSFDQARVRRSQSDITGDTVTMAFTFDKLTLTRAWARLVGATLASGGYNLQADSLAVDTPNEQLHEIRLFKHGVVKSPADTTLLPVDSVRAHPTPATRKADSLHADSVRQALPRNTLTGTRVVASFRQADSGATVVTRLDGLLSTGNATSWFRRQVVKNGQPVPSINYTVADTIRVLMRGDADSIVVDAVEARGHVRGVQADSNEAALSRRKPAADSAHPPANGGRP